MSIISKLGLLIRKLGLHDWSKDCDFCARCNTSRIWEGQTLTTHHTWQAGTCSTCGKTWSYSSGNVCLSMISR